MNFLESSTPKLNLGGTFRTADPSDTLRRLKPLLPDFGITRVADVTGLDKIHIPVVMCVRPNSKGLSVSQGKGVSLNLAKASGIMESIEIFHAENLPQPAITTSYRELCDTASAVDPQDLHHGGQWGRYYPDLPLSWLCGHDLMTGETVYVPHGSICIDMTTYHPDRELFTTSSNGLASGNHLVEAIAHGLFEVIERDSKWRWNQLPHHQKKEYLVEPHTITSPMLRALLKQFEAAGVSVFIWDVTSEVGVPTYQCLIEECDNPYRSLGFAEGVGCHSAKEIALSRALTEAAQSRLTIIVGSRDSNFPSCYVSSQERVQISVAERLALSVDDPKLDFRHRADLPATLTFEAELRQLGERLAANGFEQVVVVNHTRPEFGIPVVSVIVPGMYAEALSAVRSRV